MLENNNAIVFGAGPTVTAAAAAAGATNVKVASVNGFTVGMHVTIDTGANAESKVIQTVGTPGAGGTGITLTTALANAHASGVPFYGPTATDPTGDMTKVFGEGSPEWNEGRDSQIAPFATAARAKALTDFVGIAIHCGCRRRDLQRQPEREARPPPGRAGRLQRVRGPLRREVRQPGDQRRGAQPSNDTNGDPIVGPVRPARLPGLRRRAGEGLARLRRADAGGGRAGHVRLHLRRARQPPERVPGPAGPERRLPAGVRPGRVGLRPDAARLRPGVRGRSSAASQRDGITKQNTLFVLTADENDHFAGGNSSDGTWSHTFCNIDAGQQCPANQIGEVNANLLSLIPIGTAELLGAQRLGTDGLRERRPGAHGRDAPQARA